MWKVEKDRKIKLLDKCANFNNKVELFTLTWEVGRPSGLLITKNREKVGKDMAGVVI